MLFHMLISLMIRTIGPDNELSGGNPPVLVWSTQFVWNLLVICR